MPSPLDRLRQWLGLTEPRERTAVDRRLTIQEKRVAKTERVIAEYRRADLVSDAAIEAVIKDARRDDR